MLRIAFFGHREVLHLNASRKMKCIDCLSFNSVASFAAVRLDRVHCLRPWSLIVFLGELVGFASLIRLLASITLCSRVLLIELLAIDYEDLHPLETFIFILVWGLIVRILAALLLLTALYLALQDSEMPCKSVILHPQVGYKFVKALRIRLLLPFHFLYFRDLGLSLRFVCDLTWRRLCSHLVSWDSLADLTCNCFKHLRSYCLLKRRHFRSAIFEYIHTVYLN